MSFTNTTFIERAAPSHSPDRETCRAHQVSPSELEPQNRRRVRVHAHSRDLELRAVIEPRGHRVATGKADLLADAEQFLVVLASRVCDRVAGPARCRLDPDTVLF